MEFMKDKDFLNILCNAEQRVTFLCAAQSSSRDKRASNAPKHSVCSGTWHEACAVHKLMAGVLSSTKIRTGIQSKVGPDVKRKELESLV